MTQLSQKLHERFSHFSHTAKTRRSRKFTLWLSGLALALGGLTLAQAGHLISTPAANGVADTSVRASSTDSSGAKSSINPTNIKVEANDSTSADNSDSSSPHSSTHITVNGHSIAVPKNGSVHTTV